MTPPTYIAHANRTGVTLVCADCCEIVFRVENESVSDNYEAIAERGGEAMAGHECVRKEAVN